MQISLFTRYALSCVAAAMLAGCGGSQPPIGAPGAMPESRNIVSNHTIAGDSVEAATSSYHALYSFGGPPDGGFPEAGLSIERYAAAVAIDLDELVLVLD